MSRSPLRSPLARAAALGAVLAFAPGGDAQPEPLHRLSVCFAPGTPLAHQDAMKASVALYQAEDDARWARTAIDGSFLRRGEPTTLTWSVVPDGTPIPGYVGEGSADSNLRAWLNGKYGSESAWRPIFERVFERWSELSGVTYVHESADDGSTLGNSRGVRGVRADIRIGGHRIDGNNGTLAYNFFPDDGDMVIDTSDRFFDNTSNDSRRLRNVIAHEHGHGLGLDHVCPVNGTKLMEPTSSTAIDGPQLDDVLAAQRLYGDRLEDNDTPASATDLGPLGSGETVIDDVSIDGDGDVDVFAFTGPASGRVDIVLVPIGVTYSQGAQSANGSCSSGVGYDALRRLDLSVELVGPDGALRLGFSDAAPEGGTEEIVGVALASDARHYVRVRGDADDVQLYRLVIDVADPATLPTAVDDDASTPEAVPARVDVLANDQGVGSDTPVTVVVTGAPSNGAATTVGGGVIRYAPARDFVGADSFTYTLRDRDGNTSSGTVRVDVEEALYAGDARFDGDGDEYPDELEVALGVSSSSAAARPASGPPGDWSADTAKGLLRFRKDGKDAAVLRGRLPLSPTFERDGTDVVVSVGGSLHRFTLDRKGRGRDGSAVLRIGTPGDAGAVFKLRIRKADLAAAWSDEGFLLEDDVTREYRELTVFVIAGTDAFQTTLPLRYSVRRDKGKSKLLTD